MDASRKVMSAFDFDLYDEIYVDCFIVVLRVFHPYFYSNPSCHSVNILKN